MSILFGKAAGDFAAALADDGRLVWCSPTHKCVYYTDIGFFVFNETRHCLPSMTLRPEVAVDCQKASDVFIPFSVNEICDKVAKAGNGCSLWPLI
jgi:hypothetical protein